MNRQEQEDWYRQAQEAANLVPGTRVRITEAVPSMHNGWSSRWVPSMNHYIGTEQEVMACRGNAGVRLQGTGTIVWPFYILEVLERPKAQDTIKTLAEQISSFAEYSYADAAIRTVQADRERTANLQRATALAQSYQRSFSVEVDSSEDSERG